ncbi:MAG TPA: GAF domain-containing protein [Planktothrix sp.]|jgi:GAF domain-containing protein
MSAQYESIEKTWDPSPADLLRLFQRVGHVAGLGRDRGQMLRSASEAIGSLLPLDRCLFLLFDEPDDEREADDTLSITAEYVRAPLKAVGARRYRLSSGSELYKLLHQGKPVPFMDIRSEDTASSELSRLISDSGSKSVIGFPLVVAERLLGCMSFHQCQSSHAFPEQVIQLGEALAEELALAVERSREQKEHESEGRLFSDAYTPALILDRRSNCLRRVNQAAYSVLDGTRKDLQGLPVSQVIPDGQRLISAGEELSRQQPAVTVPSILVGTADGKPVHMDACMSLLTHESRDDVLVMFVPVSKSKSETGDAGGDRAQRAEELANSLTRQLSWERWARQIICKLHATLDRDTLLQTVVDGFGRALGASRCLIVRTDGPATSLVTHEYVEPDISPLGLGRTGQFPPVAVSFFKHKVGAVADLAALERSGDLSAEEYEYFSDNGIRSMAGAPITSHGVIYGVIIILESGAGRKWAPYELDMLEIAANQTAVALGHSQAYLQLKDQLFNMNLLGNLTQQLTNTLELVSKSGKAEAPEEKARQAGNSPPLSLRELEVLKLIAAGLANREIAQRLFLTESTVELHASRIRKKLKLKSRTALVKYACDNGLA